VKIFITLRPLRDLSVLSSLCSTHILLFAGRSYQSLVCTSDPFAKMLHTTFVFCLLARAASAQYPVVTNSALPSFTTVTLSATMTSPCSETPVATPTSSYVDDDQPAPYESFQIPASESFDPSKAPAFTGSAGGVLDGLPGPQYSSASRSPRATPTPSPFDDDQPAPYESIQVPASESFNPSKAPAFTGSAGGVPGGFPGTQYASTPCSTQATPTPLPQTTTAGVALSPVSTLPIESPHPEETPCAEDDERTPLGATAPFPSHIAFPTGILTGGFPHFPLRPTGHFPYFPAGTGSPHRGHRHGRPFGWRRPHASGMGAWHPTGVFRHGPHPSATFAPESYGVGVGKGFAATTPCTLETRVRPTPTKVAS
jgi:hypothetical protein